MDYSPTPWVMLHEFDDDPTYIMQEGHINEGDVEIARLEPSNYAYANAKRIVKAVNNFDEVVELLKACLAHAENMTCELAQTDDLTEYPYIQRARAILAKLERET